VILLATKSGLAKELRKQGIPIPKQGKVADYEHRLKHWLPGPGWVVRLAKPSSRMPGHPVQLLKDTKTMYWIPNSDMAREIIESKIVFVLQRTTEPLKDTVVIEIPTDYGVNSDDSNDNTDS
jgi:hypothetical protein